MAAYKLTCLVEGERSTFSVLVSHTCDVDELKENIYQKRRNNLFRGIDAADLLLSKVCLRDH